jgi:hypothetical protein
MLKESIANLEYLIAKLPQPEFKQSFSEQKERCMKRLAELEAVQKAATQS